MHSTTYPILFTALPLSHPPYSSFVGYLSAHQQLFPETGSYSAAFLYPSAPNYLFGSYGLLQSSGIVAQIHSETIFGSISGEEPISSISSKNCMSVKMESRAEVGESPAVIKKEEEIFLTQNIPAVKLSGKKERKIRAKDLDYVPHRREKKEIRKRVNENQNRNVISNEINQILSFIQKRAKSEALLRRIWERYAGPEGCSVARFYLLQGYLKDKIGHYSNEASLKFLNSLVEPQCKIWPENQQRHYIMLSRVLIGHFLREDSILTILTSKRMKSDKKREHLRTRRLLTCLTKAALTN